MRLIIFALWGVASAATSGNMNGHYQTASVDNVSTMLFVQLLKQTTCYIYILNAAANCGAIAPTA